jgi:CubicO group peptidase (beta-lactamase class C family)
VTGPRPRPSHHGWIRHGYEEVADEFDRVAASDNRAGAAFAAVVDGELVADLWGGHADSGAGEAWARDTLVSILSGTKGMVASCLLILLDDGRLALDVPVCDYWPEFAANGKEAVTVRHVVSHQAGLPGLVTPISNDEAVDQIRIAGLLADQAPVSQPGTEVRYHAMTFGWLCGELVRRVDGRSVGQFFRDEIGEPLALEAWIGLPGRLEPRVATLQPGPGWASPAPGEDRSRSRGSVSWSIWDNPPRYNTASLPWNESRWRLAEIPGSGGIASARALAVLYGMLAGGGAIGGVRVLSDEAVARGQTCLARGWDADLQAEVAFGVGFQLQTATMPFGRETSAFGHSGAGGSVHGGWPALRTGFSYAMNQLRDNDSDRRAGAILDALHRAVRGSRGEGIKRATGAHLGLA